MSAKETFTGLFNRVFSGLAKDEDSHVAVYQDDVVRQMVVESAQNGANVSHITPPGGGIVFFGNPSRGQLAAIASQVNATQR